MRPDYKVAVERWSNERDPLYVTLDGDTPLAAVDVAVANLDLFIEALACRNLPRCCTSPPSHLLFGRIRDGSPGCDG